MGLGTRLLRNLWIQRITFWCVSLFFFFRLFSFDDEIFISLIDLLYATLFLILLVPSVLLVNHWLIPRFIDKGRYGLFLVLFTLVSLAGTQLNMWFFGPVVDIIFPNLFLINYYSFTELWQFYLAFPAVAGLLQLSKGWFRNLESTKRIEQLKTEKLEAELKSLKGQVNPHFLFNALNSIYGLALKNSSKTADSVMLLSDLLRYSLYQGEKDFVRLEDEIEMIQKYIEIQETRLQKTLHWEMDFDGYTADFQIIPMLLQPLFENAFKHGHVDAAPFVKAQLSTSNEGHFSFSISNARALNAQTLVKESGGVGLNNIRKRLELVYPERHRFETETNATHFTVILDIYAHARA